MCIDRVSEFAIQFDKFDKLSAFDFGKRSKMIIFVSILTTFKASFGFFRQLGQ